MISGMGDPEGNNKGGFVLLDGETFKARAAADSVWQQQPSKLCCRSVCCPPAVAQPTPASTEHPPPAVLPHPFPAGQGQDVVPGHD